MREPIKLTGPPTKSVFDSLIGMPMFANLNITDLELASEYMNLIDVNAGDMIFREGDIGDYVCFVVNGQLEVIKKTENGKKVVLCKLRYNSSIGEMALIDEFQRSASVRAYTKATLITLTRTSFNRILGKHPYIGIQILKGISRLLTLNLRKTSSRLAGHLLPLG